MLEHPFFSHLLEPRSSLAGRVFHAPLALVLLSALAACGSHAAEDALPDTPAASEPSDKSEDSVDKASGKATKTEGNDDNNETDLANTLRKNGELNTGDSGAAGQEEGICGTRLSLDVEAKGRTTPRYVLTAQVPPGCAEGNDVLVSIQSRGDVRTTSGGPCESSAVPTYDVVCRVSGADVVRAGSLTIPVIINGSAVPPGGAGDSRFDFRYTPRLNAYAEFVPSEWGVYFRP